MPDLLHEAKAAMRSLGLHPRKGWGQNFMIREAELSFVCGALSLEEGDTVLEIGPGLGFLTRHLLETPARVLAVDKDRTFVRFLKETYRIPGRLILLGHSMGGLAAVHWAAKFPDQLKALILSSMAVLKHAGQRQSPSLSGITRGSSAHQHGCSDLAPQPNFAPQRPQVLLVSTIRGFTRPGACCHFA